MINENKINYIKKILTEELMKGIIEVNFTKKDGAERRMPCTLLPKYLPLLQEDEKSSKKKSENIITVWSLDKNAWRCFRLDSLNYFIIGDYNGSSEDKIKITIE